mgnify:CR=1 FL=1
MAVSKYNKYSAFFDSLNDNKAAFDFEKEQMYDTIEEIKNNSLKGKTSFSGKILEAPVEKKLGNSSEASSDATGKKVFFTKVRLDDIEDQFVPDPNDTPDPNLRKKIISQHKTGVFSPADGKNTIVFAPGDVVECNFSIGGPNDNGKLRGLTFTDNVISREAGNNTYYTKGDSQSSFTSPKNNATPVVIEDVTTQLNPNYRQPDKMKYKGKAGEFEVFNGVLQQGMLVRSNASLRGTEILIDCLEDFERLCAAFEAANLTTAKKPHFSGFRSYENQVKVREDPEKQYKKDNGKIGYLGAYPGTSNHGWGVAIDVSTKDKNGKKGFDGLVYKWLAENASKYNFFHPKWAQKTGSKPEPWHWEYSKKNKLYKK